MNWQEKADRWISYENLNQRLKEELGLLIRDEKKLEDAFYKDLEFGTGGMRGEIGAGTNRMNIYTVRKASAGLAAYIEENGAAAKNQGVVIAYDSRHMSREFAMEAAKTLATRGIQTYVFSELRPTPELSFAVRHLQAFAGIVITASHNPPEYNGYKVYGTDGSQLPPKLADIVISKVNEIDNELLIEVDDEVSLKASGLINMVGEEIDREYTKKLITISENPALGNETDLAIVFTPLHGTANKPVRAAFNALNYQNVYVVMEQELPDPEFSTVKSPNPEEKSAFEMAIKVGMEKDADLLIATDPDADRLGIAVRNQAGEFALLTGNQTGALLLHYILSQKKEKNLLPENGVVLKTIVTSELGRKIASSFQAETVDVLTGFKFIAEKMKEYEETGQYKFLFGYEESYGYLIGDFARDKDAVQAALLAAEAAAFYKKKGMTLYEGLLALFDEFGYFLEGLESITLKGKEGAELIQKILTSFRENSLIQIAGIKVAAVEDYLTSVRTESNGNKTSINLPKSNVIKYLLEDGTWICLRPSGTEPKMKFYFGVDGGSFVECEDKLNKFKRDFMEIVNQKLNSAAM